MKPRQRWALMAAIALVVALATLVAGKLVRGDAPRGIQYQEMQKG